jgi:predicted secreted protein
MTTAAVAGIGTLFKRGTEHDSSVTTYASIGEVNSISWDGMSRETYDVTTLDSTGGYAEFITGLRDAGSLNIDMNFQRDTYVDMLADFEASTACYYQIVLSDTGATTLTFQGYVTALPLTIPTKDKITCAMTIKITGAPSLSS